MQSFFSRATEHAYDQKAARQPSYLFGALVKTSDVVLKQVKNPFFCSLWNMSPRTASGLLQRDGQQVGYSVVAPDHDRPESRKSWTYVDPLMPGVYSNAAGKIYAHSTHQGEEQTMSVDGSTTTYAHMVTNNRSMPTGVTLLQQKRNTGINSNSLYTPAQNEANTPLVSGEQTNSPTSFLNPGPDNVQVDRTANGQDQVTSASGRTSMGTNSSTGTNLVPNTVLEHLVYYPYSVF